MNWSGFTIYLQDLYLWSSWDTKLFYFNSTHYVALTLRENNFQKCREDPKKKTFKWCRRDQYFYNLRNKTMKYFLCTERKAALQGNRIDLNPMLSIDSTMCPRFPRKTANLATSLFGRALFRPVVKQVFVQSEKKICDIFVAPQPNVGCEPHISGLFLL